MKKYVILGGGGCFGNHLALHVNGLGHEVVSIGRSPRDKEWQHLGFDIPHHVIDIRDTDKLITRLFLEKPDYIVNFAALAYATSWDNPDPYYQVNLTSVVKLTEKFREFEKFIQIGSSEIYGSTDYPAEEDDPINPTSPYAVSKLAADLHLLSMRNIPVNVIRPSNCYGPGQYPYRIIPKCILYMLENKRFPLHGGGEAKKSFMYVDDLSFGIELICRKAPVGEVYNLGVDKPISMREITEEIVKQTGKPGLVYHTPGREYEDSCYWINSTKAKALGWEPIWTLHEGIAEMIRWCEKYQRELALEPDTFSLRV